MPISCVHLLRVRHVATTAILVWLASTTAGSAPPVVSREPELKAAALYNIIAFTEWPDGAFISDEAPLIIGILGQTPVSSFLNDIVAKETWRGRRLKLLHVATPADAKACHVLFVGRVEQSRWRAGSAAIARLPILVVGETDKFAEQGGMVQFAIEQNRLRLTVNLESVRSAGLNISSKVLRLAQVLDTRNP